jgi:hypothetical protein
VNFQIDRRHIYITVTIDGIKSHALLDTGAQGNAINARFIGKNELKFKRGSVMIDRQLALALNLEEAVYDRGISSGVNTAAENLVAKAHSFKFGPFELENIDIRFVAEGEQANLDNQYGQSGSRIKSKRIQGILGFDILKHFVVTLDYRTGKAHIALPSS